MFVWFKLVGIEDSSKLNTEKARNQKVLLVPGESFLPTARLPWRTFPQNTNVAGVFPGYFLYKKKTIQVKLRTTFNICVCVC